MRVTKSQLQEMVQEAVSAYLKENAQDKAIIANLKPVFHSAITEIQNGLRKYHQVMSELSMASNERVKDIGVRGTETSQHEMDRWKAIADDLFIAEWELDYDSNAASPASDEDQARIDQYSDEHDNRGTLGEPKV